MSLSYRVALGCWLVPLVLGLGVYVAMLVTGWESLVFAGLYMLMAGLMAQAVGLAALLDCYFSARAAGLSRPRAARRPALAALLLLSNLPVAYGVLFHLGAIEPIQALIGG